jgi:hypothetical protein
MQKRKKSRHPRSGARSTSLPETRRPRRLPDRWPSYPRHLHCALQWTPPWLPGSTFVTGRRPLQLGSTVAFLINRRPASRPCTGRRPCSSGTPRLPHQRRAASHLRVGGRSCVTSSMSSHLSPSCKILLQSSKFQKTSSPVQHFARQSVVQSVRSCMDYGSNSICNCNCLRQFGRSNRYLQMLVIKYWFITVLKFGVPSNYCFQKTYSVQMSFTAIWNQI